MFQYFAYGSVLSLRHVEQWAFEHGVDAALFAVGQRAVLPGYRLVFDVQSRYWGGRAANLTADPQGEVHGVLFSLPDSSRDSVARKEGVPTGLSMELPVTVRTEAVAGATSAPAPIAATAFVARPEKRSEPGTGSAKLLAALVEGARERKLPAAWIAFLEGQLAQAAARGLPLVGGQRP